MRHALGHRIDRSGGHDAAFHRVVDDKIERVQAGHAEAVDIGKAGEAKHPAIVRANRLGRERGGNKGQIVRLAGDHRDVEQIALVAAAPPGECDQRHSHRRVGIGRQRGQRRRGRLAGPGRGLVALDKCQLGSVQIGAQADGGLRDEESGDPLYRAHLAAQAEADADRHVADRRELLAHQQLCACLVGMIGDEAADCRAGALAFAADDLAARLRPGRQLALAEHRAGAGDQFLAEPLRLGRRLKADDRNERRRAPALFIGEACLVAVRPPEPARAAHRDAVRPDLFKPHSGEVADHVGDIVALRVADFVKQLLGDRADRHHPAGRLRLGDHQRAILAAFADRHADPGPVRHIAPVGESAAGHLRRTFEQMARQRAGRQQIEIVRAPAEFVDQRPERHGAVDGAAGDDDVGPGRQRGGDREAAGIGHQAVDAIGTRDLVEHRRAVEHVAGIGSD